MPSLTTIPDNAVQSLIYVDPSTGNNQSCTENCPLLTNSSVLYQDFIFQEPRAITGFQLKLLQWVGTGPGLHILQLLSSGAFADAVDAQNSKSCYAPVASNITSTGTWTPQQANTDIAGTVQTVLVSEFPVGTSPANGPTFTWMPYVSASGQYDINFLVPGCDEFQDCDLRTSVDVTVFPGGNLDPWVTTVSQRNTQDSVTNIYSGVIVPSSPSFVATITMALAKSPEGSGSGGNYRIVADRVQLVLKSPDINGTVANGGGAGSKTGFGLLEWPLSANSARNTSVGILPNTTQTPLDIAGFDLFNALGGSTNLLSSGAFVDSVVQHPSGTLFLAGRFTLTSGTASGASNIVAFGGGALHTLSNNGLNGNVSALLLVGNRLYVGGRFTDTATGSTNSALSGVAVYDVIQNQWSALGGGVDGIVSGLGYTDGRVQVAGNFTRVRSSGVDTEGLQVPGLASWSVETGGWTSSGGYLVGSLDVIVNGTRNKNAQDVQYVAGHISSSLRYGANGFALLATGPEGGLPEVTTLNTTLNPVGSNSSSPSRRSEAPAQKRGFMPSVTLKHLFKRQQSSTPTETPSQSGDSPAIYAGAFWTNSSSKQQIVILGGNFSLPLFNGASGIAAYNIDTGALSPLPGSAVTGIIRALFINGDTLYVGGQFTIQGSNLNGFAIYDLVNGRWAGDGLQPLVTSNGTVSISSLTLSEARSDTLIVAGSFDGAGSFPCRAICGLNINTPQWTTLGSGLSGGQVSTLVLAGVCSCLPEVSL